jgi:DNA-directed RNA polymerase II subunit RPB2
MSTSNVPAPDQAPPSPPFVPAERGRPPNSPPYVPGEVNDRIGIPKLQEPNIGYGAPIPWAPKLHAVRPAGPLVPGLNYYRANRYYPPDEQPPPPLQALPKISELKLHSANPNTIVSRKLLDTYFKTTEYPFTRHHIDSFDQFVAQDVPAILKSNNPILLLKELNPSTGTYMYRVEIFIGGRTGEEIEIGAPTIALQKGKEVRILFPNEARLRNLTYASTIYATIRVELTITLPDQATASAAAAEAEPIILEFKRMPLFQLPILLHSRNCVLHAKPASFLKEAGECPQDQGGYFIVEGAEKVLITRQEQAFNTLYVQKQPNNDKVETYGNITCLSSETRQVKVVTFNWVRATDTLVVSLPYVRKPLPVFMLFRAMGVQSDEDILRLLYPDLESAEAKLVVPHLLASIAEAFPFTDTYSSVQFIKAMTKGFSEEHVYDILFNQTFIHISDKQGGSRVHFLADCVRRFMRVHLGIDPNADRDDTRNQRALTSGHLIRMLFSNAYTNWKKAVRLAVDSEYAYNVDIYKGLRFANIFSEGNIPKLFVYPGRNEKGRQEGVTITAGVMRGFKGRWVTGGSGGGGALGHSDEKTGALQSLSRISYLDFMSHTRRVVLNFDTGMKLTRPRQLHTSQYGFFCTNETPGGASIGITKNLAMMTMISIACDPAPVLALMLGRGWVIPCSEMRNDLMRTAVPVFLNNGIVGYTLSPFDLTDVLKRMKWTGCLPAFASISFSIRNRKVLIFMDEGRPTRPLIHLEGGVMPKEALQAAKTWRDLVLGDYAPTAAHGLSTSIVVDPFAETPGQLPFTKYIELLTPHCGYIEYVDPYEQNEGFIVNFPEHLTKDASHMEVHPCTIVSVVNGMIPFANFNQSPRNQLSCSQSKQGVGMYATNFQNRYDNSANIMCYGEAPLVRTLAYDVLGEGQMPYGHNLIMAIMPFQGYNQDDGIVFNDDSFQRGMFRNINYRSYEAFEEYDRATDTRATIANPLRVQHWTDLKPGRDYKKLDERGIIKVGELVDEETVLVGRYIQDKSGKIQDSSLTAQVWTSGRVESVVVTVNNMGMLLVKVRITQDRTPELGDKFSTRHGQKGTIGMRFRAHDLPRTAEGLVPDMLVNPHCIPSRMTVAQLMEMIFGEVCYKNTMIGDATLFMSDSSAPEAIGRVLEGQFGLEKAGNQIMYDGASGVQMPTTIFSGPVFAMRLKHMVEDKWNARAEGRREQRTRQPTGGRGAQGGLRIGEMERDALAGHGISRFLRESLMERADLAEIRLCNGCGTVPIFNKRQNLFVCPLCDGPVRFMGTTAQNMELLPTPTRSLVTTDIVEMPYATKLLAEELQTYMNMGMRILTGEAISGLKEPEYSMPGVNTVKNVLAKPLPEIVLPETRVPPYREGVVEVLPSEEQLGALGVLPSSAEQEADVAAEQEAVAEAAEEEAYVPLTPIEMAAQRKADSAAAAAAAAPVILQQQPQGQPPSFLVQQPMIQQVQPIVQLQPPPFSPPPAPPSDQEAFNRGVAAARQQMNQQAVQQGGTQYITPAPMMYASPVGGAQVITVDTGPRAMYEGGFQEDLQEAMRGHPVMGGGSSGSSSRRHTTPRHRSESPRRGPMTVAGGNITPTTRIVVNRIG